MQKRKKMGLDIYHAIPSIKTNDTLEFFTMDEFAANPDFLKPYNHLLVEIDDFDFEVLIFPDQRTKDLVIQRTPGYSEKPAIVGEYENIAGPLLEIATRHGLQHKEPMVLKSIDNLLSLEIGREVYYHTAWYDSGAKKIKGLYWTEKGYQRKNMSPAFYQDFENCKLYFDKAAVIKASAYLQTRDATQMETLRAEFKTNFIDNFVEGESIFFASW